jgi:hypothetical protein
MYSKQLIAGESSSYRQIPRMLRYLLVDSGLLVLYALALDVPLTGIAIHEWIGITVAGLLVVHLLQHPKWIAITTNRFWSKASFKVQLNFVVMIGLFISFASLVLSGIMISQVAVDQMGFEAAGTDFWTWLHLVSVDWVAWIVGVHIALNWQWIVGALRKYVREPLAQKRSKAPEVSSADGTSI